MAAPQDTLANNQDQEPYEAKGFAKLDFPDGDYIITTTKLVIGRNTELADQWKRHRKQERHQQRAREALEQYELEPSQPSQPDDGTGNAQPSSGSRSLEGTSARNFSEQGGAVHYHEQSDDEAPRSKKRRRLQYSNSSTTSVTPASVHPSQIDLSGGSWSLEEEPENHASARLPVHPARQEDIKRISHEHLEINYNSREEQWELHVVGNRAFVNEQLLNRGSIVPLEHNDEIMIPGVHMTFKLPDNFRSSPVPFSGTFSEAQASDLVSVDDSLPGTSPVRRLSRAIESAESSDEDSDQDSDSPEAPQKKSGIKLKFKKGGKTTPASGKTVAKSPEENHKSEKAAKTKLTDKFPDDVEDDEGQDNIPVLDPGSALADVPQDQLPQKRKGPGRPPKNGFVSKKDDKQVRKRIKEYESRGEEAPSYALLVDEVRREAKLKEQQSKSGQLSLNETSHAVRSIEAGNEASATDGTSTVPIGSVERNSQQLSQQGDRAKRSSPKPKQIRKSRSPSPVRPLSECTEEELKKPNMTYVPLIDEAIRNSKKGYADLQEIYRTIQKLHPFFAYTAKGTGWQSSVRHNLKSERFKQVGKSGKGAYHAINTDFPLPNSDQKKGRRSTPPPRQGGSMINGQYPNGQMPHMPYGQPHQHYPDGQINGHDAGAAHLQGNAAYQSPYVFGGPQGTAPGSAAYASHGGPNGKPAGGNPATQNQTMAQSQQGDSYGGLVAEIMDWRINYLKPFLGSDVYPAREQTFKGVLEHLSAIFSLPNNEYEAQREVVQQRLATDDERRVFTELARLFDKYHKAEADAAKTGADAGINIKGSAQISDKQDAQSSVVAIPPDVRTDTKSEAVSSNSVPAADLAATSILASTSTSASAAPVRPTTPISSMAVGSTMAPASAPASMPTITTTSSKPTNAAIPFPKITSPSDKRPTATPSAASQTSLTPGYIPQRIASPNSVQLGAKRMASEEAHDETMDQHIKRPKPEQPIDVG